jgi:hypothetical protein
MTGCGVVFRCMLIGRTIAAADVTAFGASAKMKPPTAGRQAFGATWAARLGQDIDAVSLGLCNVCTCGLRGDL